MGFPFSIGAALSISTVLFPVDPPEKIEDQKAREGKRKAGQGAPLGGFPRVDRKAADPGAEGIARIERGETDMQLSSFLKIAHALKIEFSPVFI